MGKQGSYLLLIESDDVVSGELTRKLETIGYTVLPFSDPKAASEKLAMHDVQIDIALIDGNLGNAWEERAPHNELLKQTRFPIVALISLEASDTSKPRFASWACLEKNACGLTMEQTLGTACRLFEENQILSRQNRQHKAALVQAKLGHWEFDSGLSLFTPCEVLHQVLGLPNREAADLDAISRIYLPESSDALRGAIEQALLDEKPFNFVSELKNADDQKKWVRTQGQVVPTEQTAGLKVFGTIQDISDIRLLNRVAQESVLTLNQVERLTHIGHWSVSLIDGSIYHSDEIKRIFGYEPAQYALSVEEAIDAYHPDDRGEVMRLFNRAVETGENYEFDLRIIQPNSDIRHVHSKGYTEKDSSGEVVRVYGTFQDNTDEITAQHAIKESEAWLKALVDGVQFGIVVHDAEGAILLGNRMAKKLLAPSTQGPAGRKLNEAEWRLCREDGSPVPQEELPARQIIESHQPIENVVIGSLDGDRRTWMLVNGVPVFDDEDRVSKVIISFVDITARKEMEERLHQAEKMKATGQLAGGVAHDFNNQLTVMLNFAELLKTSLPASGRQQDFVKGIMSGITRSADLTKQLLAFARKGKYTSKTVNMDDLIAEVVSMARHTFDKKIVITHHRETDSACSAGDSSQLQNALLNMAINSRDSMPDGGDLRFETKCVSLQKSDLKDSGLELEPGNWVRVTLRDTGKGMNDATRRQIFEPFFTTKALGKGTGMGMASVYGTIKNHRGGIQVESTLGKGTAVTIYLPQVPSEDSPAEQASLPRAMHGGRIMIIDDDKDVAQSMSAILESEGFQTTTHSQCRSALEDFKSSWQEIDLVILDMIMPDMNGTEVFRALKAIDAGVKVLIISGYSFTADAKKVCEEGALRFLEKPIRSRELLTALTLAMHSESSLHE